MFLKNCVQGIETWSKVIKLTLNPDKPNFCIFSTDRKNRKSFQPIIKLCGSVVKQIMYPKYLGLTLDSELGLSQHLEKISNKAIITLNILKDYVMHLGDQDNELFLTLILRSLGPFLNMVHPSLGTSFLICNGKDS